MRRLFGVWLCAVAALGQNPLFDGFLANDGQFPQAVRFIHLARFEPYYVTRDSYVLFNQVRIRLDAIDPRAEPVGESPSPVLFNRYRGDSPSAWTTGSHLFQSVRLDNVYPGISAAFVGGGRIVFTIAPGADPA